MTDRNLPKKPLLIYVPETLADKIDELAKKLDYPSRSELIRDVLRNWVGNQNRRANEAARAESIGCAK
jgi:metal-responsive CopG/Arc/MetJ family transcriptional regulator